MICKGDFIALSTTTECSCLVTWQNLIPLINSSNLWIERRRPRSDCGADVLALLTPSWPVSRCTFVFQFKEAIGVPWMSLACISFSGGVPACYYLWTNANVGHTSCPSSMTNSTCQKRLSNWMGTPSRTWNASREGKGLEFPGVDTAAMNLLRRLLRFVPQNPRLRDGRPPTSASTVSVTDRSMERPAPKSISLDFENEPEMDGSRLREGFLKETKKIQSGKAGRALRPHGTARTRARENDSHMFEA